MSRSRKKYPLIKCGGNRSFKKIFNRRFRRNKDFDFPSGNAYRKVNESWDVCDIVMGYFKIKEIPDEDRKYWYAMK